jgi:hypothetical protein
VRRLRWCCCCSAMSWRGVACTWLAFLTRTRLVHGRRVSRTDGASERRSDNRPALSAPVPKNKKGSPVPEGSRRAGVKWRKLLFTMKTTKLGRFSQQSWAMGSFSGPTAHPGPPGALRDGADLESSVTGAEAEAPAYHQGVPPGRYVQRA